MKKPFILVGGLLGVLVGLAFIMPAVAQLRLEGALPGFSVALLLLGITLTATGGAALFLGAKGLRS